MYLCNWLKCYLSGDDLHGSGSRINPIKCYRELCYTLFPSPPGSLQLVPVTRIEQLAKRMGVWKFMSWNEEQEPEDGIVNFG